VAVEEAYLRRTWWLALCCCREGRSGRGRLGGRGSYAKTGQWAEWGLPAVRRP